jgi:hypothetical protein
MSVIYSTINLSLNLYPDSETDGSKDFLKERNLGGGGGLHFCLDKSARN